MVPWCPCREQRDPVYLRDKVTQRHCKEQFETAQKIDQEYSRYFTGKWVLVQPGAEAFPR